MSLKYDITNSTINYHYNIYKFDNDIIDKIINFNLSYKFYNDNHCKCLIEIIYDLNIYTNKTPVNFTYSFINGDNFDFRKNNIKLNISRPIFDTKENIIIFNNNIYKFDNEIIHKIINSNLSHKFDNNNHYKSLIEIIFNINIYSNKTYVDFTYSFVNGDNFDFRKNNIKLNILHPIYNTKEYIITYDNKIYKFNVEQFDKIINHNKTFIFNESNDYPVCKNNNNSLITLLEFLFNFKQNNVLYYFKNNDKYDLKQENVLIYHKKHSDILQKYPSSIYYCGHYKTSGNDAYNMKNPYWKIKEDKNNEEYYLMYCEQDTYIKLDKISLESIEVFQKNNNDNEKLTFFKMKNGYISCKLNQCNKMLYIHQIIMNLYGQGKGTNNLSVDHINRDPLDNRSTNLTIASLKEQQDNSKGVIKDTKRERKYNAQELPENIKHEDIPKYCYYCKEKYNSNGDIRDFFRIEKHPNQKSLISTSKSIKLNILDKLTEAKQIILKLDNNEYYNENDKVLFKLPVGFYVTKFRNCDHLIYDYRNIETKERKNMKMKLAENYNLEEEYNKFLEKLQKKYPEIV